MQISPNWCVLCRYDDEYGCHLFIHCPYARAIWDYFLSKLNFSWVMPKDMKELFAQCNVWGLDPCGRSFWACLIHAMIWNIWRERNSRIFKGKRKICNEVIESIIKELGSWLFVTKEFEGISLSAFMNVWVTSISSYALALASFSLDWQPPPPGILQLKFDGSSKGNLGPSGFGCVIRDCHGLVYCIIAGCIGHSTLLEQRCWVCLSVSVN